MRRVDPFSVLGVSSVPAMPSLFRLSRTGHSMRPKGYLQGVDRDIDPMVGQRTSVAITK